MSLYSAVLQAIEAYPQEAAARPVFPTAAALAGLYQLPGELPLHGLAPEVVLRLLADHAGPATVHTNSGRYFGFVTGASLPAAQAANMLAAAWDQNAAYRVMSPAAVHLEEIALRWLAQLLAVPATALGGFVTGATMANFTAMAAARHHLLALRGWDAEKEGLFGAPPFPVVVGAEVHVSVLKALAMLGLGKDRLIRVPTDSQGRMDPAQFPALSEPALVCLQAGNVNTGALDSPTLIAQAHESGSWVHVDGAFGLWSPAARYTAADSWATDGHKWLNLPYDSGIVFVRNPAALAGAMDISASYLHASGTEPVARGPESSRRARGMDAYAGLLSLGEQGVRDLIERCCGHARTFAAGLATAGVEILNEVSLNQVLAALPTEEQTLAWLSAIQAAGDCWCGSTVWRGRRAIRISVSSWATTEEDVERSLQSMLRSLPAGN